MDIQLKLKNFPISFLAVLLGLFGFSLAYQKIEIALKLNFEVSNILFIISLLLFGVFLLIYSLKMIFHFSEIKKEFNHNVKMNFFPIISIILIISSIILMEDRSDVSRYLWWFGITIHFIFLMLVVSKWIQHDKFEIRHINPSWFIPAVGSILVPISGVLFSKEISFFFFSIGLFLWIILFVIILYRVIFYHPMPDKLIPTLFILIAPPAIGFISLFKLNGGMSVFGDMLYYFGIFMLILVMFQFKLFYKLKFYLSWWAYSFPLAASTVSSILIYHETGDLAFKVIFLSTFTLLNLIILLLSILTIRSAMKGEICIEDD